MRALPLLLVLGLVLGLPAGALAGRPAKPARPTDLAIGTITMSNGSYVVPATWKAGANTASFVATVTAAGATLASAALTGTSWSPSVAAKAGTTVTVSIYGVNGKFKGPATSASRALPDVTAPVGVYTATLPAGTGSTITFTRTSLADDLSTPAGIQVSVDFGDPESSTDVLHTTGATETFDHTYPSSTSARRYQPTITVEDAAHNKAFASVNAVVIADTEAPKGTAHVEVTTGWAQWTAVKVGTTASDNVSPAGYVRRTIAWGDGSTTVATSDSASHVYATAGTFQPSVVFSDEALPQANASGPAAAGTVVIRNDVFRPRVALTLPRARRSSVRSWKVLRGTAADAETAVRSVRIKAVEKRGTAFYAYVPARRAWVKVGRQSRAFARAGYLRASTTGSWSVRLPKLTRGVLVYRAESVDAMGNVSPVAQHRQRLTRR